MKTKFIFYGAILFALIYFAQAAPIQLPHAFYGNVFNSDNSLFENGIIDAKINNKNFSSVITSGEYELIVEGDIGDIISFYVNNIFIQTYNYSALNITQLDLYTPIGSSTVPSPNQTNQSQNNQTTNTTQNNSAITYTINNHRHHSKQSDSSVLCLSNWDCSAWSECLNGKLTRYCYDTNNCETSSYNRPQEQAECAVSPLIIDNSSLNDNSFNGILFLIALFCAAIVLLIILIIILA